MEDEEWSKTGTEMRNQMWAEKGIFLRTVSMNCQTNARHSTSPGFVQLIRIRCKQALVRSSPLLIKWTVSGAVVRRLYTYFDAQKDDSYTRRERVAVQAGLTSVVLKCRINALNHFTSLSVSFMCPKRKMNATCFCLICKFVDIKVIVYYYSSHKRLHQRRPAVRSPPCEIRIVSTQRTIKEYETSHYRQ